MTVQELIDTLTEMGDERWRKSSTVNVVVDDGVIVPNDALEQWGDYYRVPCCSTEDHSDKLSTFDVKFAGHKVDIHI